MVYKCWLKENDRSMFGDIKKKRVLLIFLLVVPLCSASLEDFKDAYVVVGKNAQPSDVYAASRLADALSTIDSSPGTYYPNSGYTIIGDAYQFREPSNMLEGSENTTRVRDVITEKQLSVLQNETFVNDRGSFDYSQQILLKDGGYSVFQYADDVPYDSDNIPKEYFLFPKNNQLYKYQIIFRTPLISRIGSSTDSYRFMDLLDEEFTMLGRTFRIIEAAHPAKEHVRLKLLEEEQHAVMEEGETREFHFENSSHRIQLISVNDVSRTAFFSIDKETIPVLSVGEISSPSSSFHIYISDIIPNEASDKNDLVEIDIGTRMITLEDQNITNSTSSNAEWKVNDDNIKNSEIQINGIDGGLTEGKELSLSRIDASFSNKDSYYVGETQKLSDIIPDPDSIFLRGFDFYYYGSALQFNPIEMIVLEPIGSYRYNLNLMNKNSEYLQIPLFFNDNGAQNSGDDYERFGDSDNDLVVEEGKQISINDYFIVTSDSSEGITKARGITHLLRYRGQEVNDKTITVENVPTKERMTISYDRGISAINLDSMRYKVNVTTNAIDGNITVDMNNDGSIDNGDQVIIVTQYGSTIDLDTTTYDRLVFTTKELEFGIISPILDAYAPYNGASHHDMMRISVSEDAGGKIDINATERCLSANPIEQAAILDAVCYPTSTTTLQFMYKYGSYDIYQGTDEFGSELVQNKNDGYPDNMTIYTTRDEAESLLYISAGDVTFIPPETQEKTPIKRLITDEEALNMSSGEFIAVGGPCANKLTAKVMGVEKQCERTINETLMKEFGKVIVLGGRNEADTDQAINIHLAK